MDDASWLGQAIELAVANVSAGGGPFGAVIVREGVVVATGQNRVTRDNDPTAHAEVTAIRRACATIGHFSLAGHTLYASCEPCPLCLASSMWARLDRIVFAADRHDAAEGGFDDRAFYQLFETPRSQWAMSVESLRLDSALAPFTAWNDDDSRVRY